MRVEKIVDGVIVSGCFVEMEEWYIMMDMWNCEFWIFWMEWLGWEIVVLIKLVVEVDVMLVSSDFNVG